MAQPRNVAGHVVHPADERALLELLGRTEIGDDYRPIGRN